VEDVQEPKTEVLLEEARKVNPEAQLGDMVIVETTPADFGRVAAQTARQVIQQRIREAERSNQMQYFERQVGEIVSGIVQATNAQATTVGLDMKAEGVLPANQRIPGERFKVHDRVRAVVLEVKDGSRGPQIVFSRAHRNFLRRLLENEVPEIYHGVVEIRAIAREPGARAKVAVSGMGKFKTILQMTGLSMMMFRSDVFGLPVYEIGVALLVIAAVLTLWSMMSYLQAAWPELRRDHTP